MILFIENDYNAMSMHAASIVARELRGNPSLTLCLATGGTPELTYRILGNMCKNGDIDFAKITTFNLDEYVGLNRGVNSYYAYMRNTFFDNININPENTHIPDGDAIDLDSECLRYDGLLDSCKSKDILVTGIGINGHIGFNKPCIKLSRRTHVTKLSSGTRKANARFFSSINSVPKFAITEGSIVQSDAYRSYRKPLAEKHLHEYEVFDSDSDILHWLHIIVGNAKAYVLGTYHGLAKKHL